MGLLSTLAAHDLGYLSTDDLVGALDATLTTLEGLERYADTSSTGTTRRRWRRCTRATSRPWTAATRGALIALAQGLLELEQQPQTLDQRLDGLADTARLLAVASRSTETRTRRAGDRHRDQPPRPSDRARLRRRRDGCRTRRRGAAALTIQAMQLATPGSSEPPSPTSALAETRPSAGIDSSDADRRLARLVGDGGGSARTSRYLSRRWPALRADAGLADAMRFEFLYDRRRRIFAIGYRLADADGPGRLDASFYDLLASEARLASFVAIAKGDVPQHHWFHLGRLVTNVDGRATLMSWGGTMFEYLMPLL